MCGSLLVRSTSFEVYHDEREKFLVFTFLGLLRVSLSFVFLFVALLSFSLSRFCLPLFRALALSFYVDLSLFLLDEDDARFCCFCCFGYLS
jgi:hypothetical protein